MLQHARQCVDADIPFMFDPGQGMPMFDGNELLMFLEQATYVCVNDYESQLLQERTGLSIQQVKAQLFIRKASQLKFLQSKQLQCKTQLAAGTHIEAA